MGAILVLAASLPGSELEAAPADSRFVQDRFAIGFWVAPRTDESLEARYAEIAEANFTFVIGLCGARNPPPAEEQLKLCEKYDLKALIHVDAPPYDKLPDGPACWGYSVVDEPNASRFPALRKTVDALRAARPGKLAYINLFPDYASPAQLGFTSLAYGAKGVMYFCYWTPRGEEFPKGGAILTADGRRTRHYDEAKRINAGLKHLGPTLLKLTSTSVHRVKPRGATPDALKGSPVRQLSDGDYLAGVFRHADGRRAVLLNNYHFAYSAWPTVEFDVEPAKVVEVSPKTGREEPVRDDSPDMAGLQVSLDAGEGRLFLLPAR